MGFDPAKTVLVSGIGCSSRAPGYTAFHSLHTTHGRALAYATGVRLARPELTVIIITDDGDGASIGGNHLIHVARRNIDLTCVLLNNQTYGMTGGQVSPTTPEGTSAATAPYGAIEPPFDLCRLVTAAGATYVARGLTAQPTELAGLIRNGLTHPGFAFVEAITQCPVHFRRAISMRGAVEMLRWQRERSISVSEASEHPEAAAGRLVVVELHREERPEYSSSYRPLVARLREEA